MKRKGFAPIIILASIVLVIAGYFGYKYFKPTNQPIHPPTPFSSTTPTATPEPVSISKSAACEKAGGKWLNQYQECEEVPSPDYSSIKFDQFCKESGGTSFGGSRCRHEPGAVCVLDIVAVCKF